MIRFCFIAICGALFCGCAEDDSSGESVPTAPAQKTPGSEHNETTDGPKKELSSRDFDGLKLTIPKGWKEKEMSAMQRSVLLGQFTAEKISSDIVMTVSRAASGIDANFERWKGQITGGTSREGELECGGETARTLELSGYFRPGFGKPNRPDWAMFGVAIPSPGNDYYVKLVGPKGKISEAQKELRAMIESAEVNSAQ